MLNLLVSYAIAGACVLFMVSLPLGKMEVAGRLRRVSGALLLLAFAPYVFFDLVRALAHASPQSPASGGSMMGGGFLQVVGALALIAPIAYLFLVVRKRLTAGTRDADWKQVRSSGKRPVERDRESDHQSLLFEDDEESE